MTQTYLNIEITSNINYIHQWPQPIDGKWSFNNPLDKCLGYIFVILESWQNSPGSVRGWFFACLLTWAESLATSFIAYLGERSKPHVNERANSKAARGRGNESLQQSLINFHLYFAQTKGNSIGWKMTFGKSKLIDNRPTWPSLNFRGNVETRCSQRQNSCSVGDRWTHSEKKTGRGRKLLSPSVRWEMTVVCESNLVLRGIILEPRTCFSPQSRWACEMWFLQSFTCEIVGLSIEYCEPRIGRPDFVVLVEGKSAPFMSCIRLCQVPCLVLKMRRVKVKTDSSAWFKFVYNIN